MIISIRHGTSFTTVTAKQRREHLSTLNLEVDRSNLTIQIPTIIGQKDSTS
jgi:hypothetical protein